MRETKEETGLAPYGAATDYTYLTVPPGRNLRSCVGIVVAGLAARARIGVGGLDEAVDLLEEQQSTEVSTRYRFSLREDGLIAEVEEWEPAGVREASGAPGWRTVIEMVS